MKLKSGGCCVLLLVLISLGVGAQPKDSIAPGQVSGFFDKLKVSGLLQTQFQKMQPGAGDINDRWSIRRARLKFTYKLDYARFVLQFHATEKNVGPDELYIALSDPWVKSFTFTAGVFNRPFGNEISYPASKLESDERARIIRTIFPLEKDLGATISFHPEKSPVWNFLYVDAGFFNGTGPVNEDFDNRKNFIGHVYARKSVLGDKINAGAGISYLKGGFSNQRGERYEWNNGYLPVKVDSLSLSEQEMKGVDAQFSVKWTMGVTSLRFEYLSGTQAGTFVGSTTPNKAPAGSNGDLLPSYIRQCQGGYLIFVHELPLPKLQFTVKYDWYDPNTLARGAEIGILPNTGLADIFYQTLGVGVNYAFYNNLRLTGHYNFVQNERTSLLDYTSDVADNYLIIRLQFAF